MTTLQLRDVGKVFPGGAVGLDGVDLTVADGEFMVLVGPSGCGKSTLLRIVAGLEDPTRGTVLIDGTVVNDLPPKARDIAMVFQNYALYPHLSVESNLAFGLRIRHAPRAAIAEQVHDVAHVLALEPLLDRKPAALSGGQRQRVAMGRAMVRHPRVLLMDEPLSNLDAKLRVAMRGELMRLHREERTTTLYVTHDQVEAMTLGDRIAVLDQGRLQQVGTPEELYERPANVFVAGFIGSPSMNLAHAELVSRDGGPALVIGAGEWPLTARQARRYPAVGAGGRRLVVGWRPAALEPRAALPGERSITVEAITVESLGDQKNVLFLPPFTVPDVTGEAVEAGTELTAMWTAAVPPSLAVAPGDRVTFVLDPARAHVFDGETGAAVGTPGSGLGD